MGARASKEVVTVANVLIDVGLVLKLNPKWIYIFPKCSELRLGLIKVENYALLIGIQNWRSTSIGCSAYSLHHTSQMPHILFTFCIIRVERNV